MNDMSIIDRRAPHFLNHNIKTFDPKFTFSSGQGHELVLYLLWLAKTATSSGYDFIMKDKGFISRLNSCEADPGMLPNSEKLLKKEVSE